MVFSGVFGVAKALLKMDCTMCLDFDKARPAEVTSLPMFLPSATRALWRNVSMEQQGGIETETDSPLRRETVREIDMASHRWRFLHTGSRQASTSRVPGWSLFGLREATINDQP